MCSPTRTWIGPSRERVGYRRRCCNSTRRGREHEEEGIPLRVHLNAALGRARLPYQPAVLRERVGIAVGAKRVQQPRRALDVGEEERDGAGREVTHAHSIAPTRTCSK